MPAQRRGLLSRVLACAEEGHSCSRGARYGGGAACTEKGVAVEEPLACVEERVLMLHSRCGGVCVEEGGVLSRCVE